MSQYKNAVVTGASRGIGRAICVELSKRGVNVIINYAGNEAAANETAALCEQNGVKALPFKADVADAQQVGELMAFAQKELGSIDILVNNAGITKDNLLVRMSEEDFDAVLDTNLKGAFLCCKAVCRGMTKQRYGAIVNVGSVVGINGNAGQINYSASKAGLIGLTKSLARELAPRGVTANVVAPGFITTDMTDVLSQELQDGIKGRIPLARFGSPQDIANTVAFLTDEKAAYITGQVLCVDGGMAM